MEPRNHPPNLPAPHTFFTTSPIQPLPTPPPPPAKTSQFSSHFNSLPAPLPFQTSARLLKALASIESIATTIATPHGSTLIKLILTSLDELRNISICVPARHVGIEVDVGVNNTNYLRNPPMPPHRYQHTRNISIQQVTYTAEPIMDVQV